MTQKMIFGSIAGVGIVPVLIIIGIILIISKIAPDLGNAALVFGVTIGVGLGLMGLIGVAKRVL